jgi:hypothetical protein
LGQAIPLVKMAAVEDVGDCLQNRFPVIYPEIDGKGLSCQKLRRPRLRIIGAA